MKQKKEINRLKVVLAEKKVTSRELAKHLGKTETTVSRWCTNDSQPALETLFKIAELLQIEVRELIHSSKVI